MSAPKDGRPIGMHPDAWAAFKSTGFPKWRISQQVGGARASKGTHLATMHLPGGEAAGPCTDLHISDMKAAAFIKNWLGKFVRAGFVVYVRVPGENGWPAKERYHAHIIWPGMNLMHPDINPPDIVLHQVRDFCHKPRSRTGLVGHALYMMYNVPDELKDAIWAACEKHNPDA